MRHVWRWLAFVTVLSIAALTFLVTVASLAQPAPQQVGSGSASAPPPPSVIPGGSAAPSSAPSSAPSVGATGVPSGSASAPPAPSGTAPEPQPTVPPPFDPPFRPSPRPEVTPPPAMTPAPAEVLPPLPPKPEEAGCCRAAIRFDPFDILQRRLSFQAELAIWGPFAIEIEPSWIFSSPSDFVSASGFSFLGSVGFYLTAKAPQGFFIKAVAGYETFSATVTNPDDDALSASADVASPVLGAVLGSSTVFGRRWGFNISGSIGVGFTTASTVNIVAPGKGNVPAYKYSYYDSAVQLLGSLGVGIGF